MAEEEEDSRRNNISSSSTETAGSAETNPTNSTNHHHHHGNGHGDDDASGWLRLGIGCSAPHRNQNKVSINNNKHSSDHPPGPHGSMLELNLLPGSSAAAPFQQRTTRPAAGFLPPPPPALFYYQPPHHHQQQQLISWANNNNNNNSSSSNSNYFRIMTPVIPNYGINPMVVASSSTTQLQPRPTPTPTTSFQLPVHRTQPSSADPMIRLVDPPRRPHSGIWFFLQPSLHQSKQPFLPHLPKNYLRIKDGRMTVRFLIKYLVNKLGLENESEN
ncbi:hypothetical protein V2J09_001641 [Rumex salicifolius]